MAKVFKEYQREDLGQLYCLVDPAQLMAYNPAIKWVHRKNELKGDDCCELVVRETTERDQRTIFGH